MINMNPEAINEFVTNFNKEIEAFKKVSDDYFKTSAKLDSWQSKNKTYFENQIKDSMPAFEHLEEVVTSYRDVANKANQSLLASEELIRKQLMM